MFEDLRRAVTDSVRGPEDWSLDQPWAERMEEELLMEQPATGQALPTYRPDQDGDYYLGLVKASINSDGKLADHAIPVQWLKMILAGLEGDDHGIDLMLTEPRDADGRALEIPGLAPYAKFFPGQVP